MLYTDFRISILSLYKLLFLFALLKKVLEDNDIISSLDLINVYI
jgi:hypothetical protein